jgi:hypothetical protein
MRNPETGICSKIFHKSRQKGIFLVFVAGFFERASVRKGIKKRRRRNEKEERRIQKFE